MTRISPTLYPAPIEQARTPAGRTKAALAHGTKASSCRGEIGTQPLSRCCVSESVPLPVPEGHSQEFDRLFERANQETNDRDEVEDAYDFWSWPPEQLIAAGSLIVLLTLLFADVVYSAFIKWMIGGVL